VGLADQALCGGLTYHAGGAAATMDLYHWLGDSVKWVQTLNERQWPEKIMVGPNAAEDSWPDQQLFGLWYRVDATTSGYEDNGNITTMRRFWRQDASAQTRSALFEYAYDPLNRLRQFEADMEDTDNDGRYDYTMDEFGNITQRAQETLAGVPVGSPLDLSVDPATNRLLNRAPDGLGNMTQVGPNGMVNDQTMSWWDQGHAASFYDTTENTTWFYFYDADGKRRLKARDVYGEVDLEGDTSFYFYEGEDLICQLDRGAEMQEPEAYAPRFLLLDHLGTTRAELQFVADGAAREPTITAQYDYLPYGEEIEPAVVSTEQVKFTGKQRDTESNLDNYNARLYGSNLLRFTSPDSLMFTKQRILFPQGLNLYSYVQGNPLKFVDLNGKDLVLANGLSAKDRKYLVKHVARLYSDPNGKKILQRIENSKFVVTLGVKKLAEEHLSKAPQGGFVFGGKTRVESGLTSFSWTVFEGKTLLVALSSDSDQGFPIEVTIDPSQAKDNNDDPAIVIAHELGGHTADLLNLAENSLEQDISNYDPDDETSAEAAEKSIGKLPKNVENTEEVEKLLQKKEEKKSK